MFKKLLVVLPIVSLMAGAAVAQDGYPTRPIRLVHGFAAGGNADAVSRILADKMSLGQPVVVESKPGAGGNVASDYVSKSNADGYTLQLMVGGHTVSAALYKSLEYKPVADYEFISTIGKFPFFIAARAGAYASLADLIAKAKAAPGTIKIGHSGVGTTQHLTGELLGLRTGAKFIHIPYKGGAAASTALLGGEVDVLIDTGTVIRGQAKAGAFDVLAVTSNKRWPDSPNVPTVAETVSPKFDIVSWTGVGVPSGTPAPVAGKVRAEVHRVLALPAVQTRLRGLGAEPSPSSGEEMKAMVETQISVWNDVIKAVGIKKR
jgi:tripartite-type tricarboxylate transporter receptor subunit TctC